MEDLLDAASQTEEPAWLGPAWEQPGRSWLARYFATVKAMVNRPVPFYASLRPDGPLAPPLIFAATGMIIARISVFTQIMLLIYFVPNYQKYRPDSPAAFCSDMLIGMSTTMLISMVTLLILPAITQLLLRLFRKRAAGYEGTLRVYAYAHGTLAWFYLLPFGCLLVIEISWIILTIIGVDRMHRCGVIWAILATLPAFGVLLSALYFYVYH